MDAPLDAATEDLLVAAARRAVQAAHSPYSGVCVGAALLDDAGRIHDGCNVESASYGLTICAERTALVSAVAAGAKHFRAVAVASNLPRLLMPCGACRQFLSEFGPRMQVVVVGPGAERRKTTMDQLLPEAFTPSDLGTQP
ncbi:MAG: hypothetical protein RIR65_1431 [Planctomycetota bacterium]|jgi:cytidine deaminase